MIDYIYKFLTSDGVWASLQDLFIYLVKVLIRFIVNLANLFLEPIINIFFALFPIDINFTYIKLNQVFEYILPFSSFALDTLIVPKEVIVIVLSSVIFRITVRRDSFVLKLLISWYDKIKP